MKNKAFTLVELLISMMIIVILIGVLLPSLTLIRTRAKETAQRARQTSIGTALEAFKNDQGDYPRSDWGNPPPVGPFDTSYTGAQRLVEALVGWDLRGFHQDSQWMADGRSFDNTRYFYDANLPGEMNRRRDPYLELASVGVFRLGQLFNTTGAPPPPPPDLYPFVFTDVFGVRKITTAIGKSEIAGTPILYYKANPSSSCKSINISGCSICNTGYECLIYNAWDNSSLIALGSVTANGANGREHRIRKNGNDDYFYYDAADPTYMGGIRDFKVPGPAWPHRPDSYILISAGADGLYGTRDDIRNY